MISSLFAPSIQFYRLATSKTIIISALSVEPGPLARPVAPPPIWPPTKTPAFAPSEKEKEKKGKKQK